MDDIVGQTSTTSTFKTIHRCLLAVDAPTEVARVEDIRALQLVFWHNKPTKKNIFLYILILLHFQVCVVLSRCVRKLNVFSKFISYACSCLYKGIALLHTKHFKRFEK